MAEPHRNFLAKLTGGERVLPYGWLDVLMNQAEGGGSRIFSWNRQGLIGVSMENR